MEISDNSITALRTREGCSVYKVYLCYKGDCVKRFYIVEGVIEAIE